MLSYEQLLSKPLANPLPNNALQLTAYSLRSFVAPAFGSS
jgi:hypothetical protein